MKKVLQQLVLSLSISCLLYVGAAAATFTDVPSDAWYAEAVNTLADAGVISGVTNTTFAPNSPVTRAQYVKLLAGLSGDDLSGYVTVAPSFPDTGAATSWWHTAIEWANANKVTTGDGKGRFNPNNKITRQEMATMLTRFASTKNILLPTTSGVSFYPAWIDATSIASWAKESINTCRYAGLITGYTWGDFGPLGNATRAEAAQVIAALSNYHETADTAELAGTRLQNGLRQVDYITAKEGQNIVDVAFDTQNHLLVMMLDGKSGSEGSDPSMDGENDEDDETGDSEIDETYYDEIKKYDLASAAEVTSDAPEVMQGIITNDNYVQNFMENRYLGEHLLCQRGDIAVTDNTHQGSDSDDVVRIYRGGTLLFRGLQQQTLAAVNAVISEDQRYVAITASSLDEDTYQTTETRIYVFDVTALSECKKLDKFEDQSTVIAKFREKFDIVVQIPTAAQCKQLNLFATPLQEDARYALANAYAVFTKFPMAFFKELHPAKTGGTHIAAKIYLLNDFDPEHEQVSSQIGLAYQDRDDNYCMAVAVGGTRFGLVSLFSHEFMHILDLQVLNTTNYMEGWLSFLPAGFSYHYAYRDENQNDFSNPAYTLQDDSGTTEPYFISAYGTTYPMEDRATFFETMFSSDVYWRQLLYKNAHIKEKADELCRILRKSYRTLNVNTKWCWEQYQQ